MYAVIKTGGKQYRVAEGDQLTVEKLAAAVGEKVTFAEVLLVGGAEGVRVGTPQLADASVSAEVVEQVRGDKILVFKKRRRKNSKRLQGHRQERTQVRITGITAKA